MGKSPTAQVGQLGPYTTHVLYAMKFPTFTVDDGDTLRLDTGSFSIDMATTLGDAPFTGVMNVGLGELQADQRGWSADSILVRLPDLTSAVVARRYAASASSRRNVACRSRLRVLVELDR